MPAIEVITVGEASPLYPFEPPNLLGVAVHAAIPPGDDIAAIVKDPEGRILGYVTRTEAERIRNLPDSAAVAELARRVMTAIGRAVGPPEIIVHAYGAAGITACGLETGGAISRHDGYTGPRRSVTFGARDVTCPACAQDGTE